MLLAVLASVMIAFAIRGLMATADSGTLNTDPSAVASVAPSDAAAIATDAPEPTTTDAAAATSAPAGAVGPPEELTACVSEVDSGEDFASAAEKSAANWVKHYDASVELNAGRMTLEEAQEEWAESKREGPGDMERFDTAQAAYDEVFGSCAELADTDVSQDYADDAQNCQERGEALALVAELSQPLNADWGAHLDFMQTKEAADPVDYVADWRDDVADAPNNVDPYQGAVALLEEAPSCSI
ncbi:hypothetical protein [Ornithinimicrobium sp. INDO-MA30-4]|uniref:hypothetical protein n=1 Tax=Ornithinimicrobium sp. INDO-MA30-4 TaxID=2908651 RepID=UPI001F1F41CF|nr:hypothetical protein [Ornithinimicrobium sp. INDO-MA30-4]UJH71332.1 hypothetical protein L0A91_06120 [Ornithinimicrobium sp. INDO-MA30-4]